jgi:hypothetical protein
MTVREVENRLFTMKGSDGEHRLRVDLIDK